MLRRFLAQAKADEPVFITDVREAFLKEGSRSFHLYVRLYDDSIRRFPVLLPAARNREEKAFVESYVYALIYNILSSLGAVTIEVYVDPADPDAAAMAGSLDTVFQSGHAGAERFGYGKCLNVNERVLRVLSGGTKRFSFRVRDVRKEPAVTEQVRTYEAQPVFASLPKKAENRRLLGIDIGGTDIKLAAGVNNELVLCKEFDWYPSAYTEAEQMIDPVLLLVRLMRAGAALASARKRDAVDERAFAKDASISEMEEGIRRMEAALGRVPENFDGIGLSFPDVVIGNRIIGGETPKTKGMRENQELDYEVQFAKISGINERLAEYVTPEGQVMTTNDGPMAAFTAAVEAAAAGRDVSRGFFAHALGTDLGTGWVRPDGSIPGIPLEVYNFIIDLGSFVQKEYPSGDVRSIRSFNTGLAGTLQKYTSQHGVFRLAAKYLSQEEPEIFGEALRKGIFRRDGDELTVPVEPRDMRKPALEFFMAKAAEGKSPVCENIFRRIGTYLAVTWQETEYILRPEAKERALFGRLVREPACFALICEGAKARVPSLVQYAADSALANTDLMKQLNAHPEYTTAQFAQAVGGMYFACLE